MPASADCEGNKVSCPACPRKFANGIGLSMHLGKSQGCIDRHRASLQQGQQAPGAKRPKTDQQAAAFRKEQQVRAADELHDLREDHGVGDAGVQQVKDTMRTLLGDVQEELVRRLAPSVSRCSDVELRSIVSETLDVFKGLESGRREKAFMKSRVPYIEPVEHTLGKVTYKTVDAEGFTYSGKELTHKAYYIPISGSIPRVCQNDPNALEMIHRTQEEWSKNAPPRGTTKRIYLDIPHGDLFQEHEMLGDTQRGNPYWKGRIRIAIVLYYDGLEVANPLGFARGKHQLGVFLYSIINLDPTVRPPPPYIQLAGIALESDSKRYGPAKVFSGIDPITHEPDPELWATPGAQLRTLSAGVPMPILAKDGTMPKDPTPVHVYTLMLIADMLAAHKLGPWGESPSALVPCRQCDFDTRQEKAYAPVRFVRDGCRCRWKLRELTEVEGSLEELRSPTMRADDRAEGMQSFGVNTLHHALDRRYIPYFNVARGMLQDGMHMDDDGIFRNLAYQTWNQLFRRWGPHGLHIRCVEPSNGTIQLGRWPNCPTFMLVGTLVYPPGLCGFFAVCLD